ncbi:MAG TPA: hypothetical protein VFA54_12525 [Bryobacterales bacterium]|jgi:chromosome segregation ATPase|nr:hypothetical protein [Bryobacterales bacterium]
MEQTTPKTSHWALAALVAVLFGGNAYLLWRVHHLQAEMSDWRASMITQISELRETESEQSVSSRQKLDALNEELRAARLAAARSAGQAKIEAQRHAEQLAQKLAAEQALQKAQQERVASELSDVKQAAGANDVKIADVSKEVAATKTELESTVADLKRVTGDMGVVSGRIATNSQELAALKRLGERDYYEFTLVKTKQPQKVGDIRILLKKADPKHNKYTLDVFADDKRIEKKDKNTNEPVQFYVAGARQPCEIVVNQVKKDQLAGYLAVPKMQTARN